MAVIVPNTLTSIGESAFRYCNSLTIIDLPEGITSIGESAFHHCDSSNRLADLLLPEGSRLQETSRCCNGATQAINDQGLRETT